MIYIIDKLLWHLSYILLFLWSRFHKLILSFYVTFWTEMYVVNDYNCSWVKRTTSASELWIKWIPKVPQTVLEAFNVKWQQKSAQLPLTPPQEHEHTWRAHQLTVTWTQHDWGWGLSWFFPAYYGSLWLSPPVRMQWK